MSELEEKKSLTPDELLVAARSKFLSAKALLEHSGFEYQGSLYEGNENAVYLAGYALEFVLKRHIAIKLGWSEYPPCSDGAGSFTVHNLDRLLTFSGLRNQLESDRDMFSHWQTSKKWEARMRYNAPEPLDHISAKETVDSILHVIRWVISNS